MRRHHFHEHHHHDVSPAQWEDLKQELHRKRLEMHEIHERMHHEHRNLHRYRRYSKFSRPMMILINLGILYLLYSLFGIKMISLLFAALIIMVAVTQFIFFQRIEKRILAPVSRLIQGVNEVAQGNYKVSVEGSIPNDIGSLITSFNEMVFKLQESERLKAEYEENRKNLIANISHDLKTPISSIQGYLEMFLEGQVPPEKEEDYFKIIYNNTLYTNKLIDDLFLFAKLDMQKLDFHFKDIPIRAYMYDLFEEFQLELEERRCNFQYTDSLEYELSISLDSKRIQQSIRNIIGNALKHGPAKNPVISVKLYRQADWICLDILDNGPGIPEDKLPYIFDRFYRIDHERTKDLMSTGLGLAIARELIEAHHGYIEASNNENGGTCFTLKLPVTKPYVHS